MTGRFATLLLLLASLAAPAQADHDGRTGTWGSLLPPVHHGAYDHAPVLAPPVVVDPLFGAATPRRLPNVCLQAVETPSGWRRYYDRSCLGRHARADDLPRHCRVSLTTWGAVRRGYDAQCLFDAGYQREE